MKNFLKAATLAVAMITVPAVNAADIQKVGVVFPSKIMKESPQRERIIKKLEAEFKARYEALQALETEITKIEKTLKRDAELMANDEVTAMQRKVEVKLSEYKINRKAFEEDNRRRQGEEQQKALIVVRDVINDVAKEQGYDIILNGEQVVFAKPGYDISDLIIEEISKK
ncbi:hypothetical protein CW745_05480 [Psychromonas sp. psych-6C06]|uniref:OmpH family outer membrane protein n=1 Tax=Psychromonas sp. psych-6C06 TaxID=2058089 RepID=UPI000C34ECC8|nr:OmpH family outer membrane protein [Psychromonas sp. psych-6C06]PKF62873.1 hypothetical protein CW745_05480 [Psychromonas sp. psych-6C06]